MTSSFPVSPERTENVLAGLVGAFLFSLAGAAVWVVLDRIGIMAGLSGLVGVVCALQGYRIFGGKLSKKGVVLSFIIALLVLVLAWYGCLAYDVLTAAREWYRNGEIDSVPSYWDCLRTAPIFFEDPVILRSYLGSLALGLLFAVLGGFGSARTAFRTASAPAAAPDAAVPPVPTRTPSENTDGGAVYTEEKPGLWEKTGNDGGSSGGGEAV